MKRRSNFYANIIRRINKIQIDKKDVYDLCYFLINTIVGERNKVYDLISSTSTLINFAKSNVGYEINEQEIRRLEDFIKPPKISGDKKAGWEIEIFTFGGTMHEKGEISRHLIQISQQYKINYVKEVLSTKAFSEMPDIMY